MNLPTSATQINAVPAPSALPVSLAVSAEQRLELLEYWRSVTKRRWLVLGLAVAAALVAGVVAMALTPIYRSTVTVLIEAGKGKILSIEDVYGVNTQREHYQTQVEILKSRDVMHRTVIALSLWNEPEFDPRHVGSGPVQSIKSALGLVEPKTEWTDQELAQEALKRLDPLISVDPIRLSQLVKVSVDTPDKALSARIANALAAQYIESDRLAKFKISQEVSSFLQDRLTALRESLTTSERALQEYRERRGIVNMEGSAQTMSSQQATGTSDRLLTARARRLELEGSYLQATAAGAGGDVSSVPAVLRDLTVQEAQRSVNAITRRLSEANETLGAQHPKVQQIQSELDDANRALSTARRAVVSSLMRDYEAARSTEQSLEKALGEARTNVQAANRNEFDLAVLEREVQTNRQLYEMFMSRAKETNLASDVQANVARVVDPAVPSAEPVKPRKLQLVLVAVALALLLGALASIVLDKLDNTLKGPEDTEIRLQYPVLAAVPAVEDASRTAMAGKFLSDNQSHYAEAIRTARTGVLLSNLDLSHKILLITSALPNEGKTTLAVNLAHAHAQTKKTVLIDCDMRRSQASRVADLPPGAKGITNFVAGADMKDCLFAMPDSPLMVMPVGDLPPNPLELLLSQRFKDALKQLSDEFEMVIIDSPPVELVSDALVLAPLTTSVAFVVKAMSSPAPLVRKSLTRLQRAGGRILGIMVNHLDFDRARAYYGEYGAGSYAYGGYGAKLTYGANDTAAAAGKIASGDAPLPSAKA